MKTGPKPLPLEVRFLRHVQKTETCWNWIGYTHIGYGKFGIGGWKKNKIYLAHRVSYELFKAKIPEGLTLDHLCLNTRCVNPDHMEVVTLSVNSQRAAARNKPASCPKGHLYDEHNSRHRPNGSLYCGKCNVENVRRYRINKKRLNYERTRKI